MGGFVPGADRSDDVQRVCHLLNAPIYVHNSERLTDAPRIDGAGEVYIFHRLVIPLCKPVLATLVSFYFMWNWNDFLWPLIVITSREEK